jgi:hypothetical protein
MALPSIGEKDTCDNKEPYPGASKQIIEMCWR